MKRSRSWRHQQIIEMRLSGATLASIGALFGMSRQAVYHIVKDEEQTLREYLEDMEQLESGAPPRSLT